MINQSSYMRDCLIHRGVLHHLASLMAFDITISCRRQVAWVLVNLARDKPPQLEERSIMRILKLVKSHINNSDINVSLNLCVF